MPVIYKISCSSNNKVYIGSTINVKRRWEGHRGTLKRGINKSTLLQNSWNKYGKDSFSFEIIENVDISKMFEREQFWIDYYKSANPQYGLNIVSNVLSKNWLTNNKLEEKEVIEMIQFIEQGQKRTDIAKKFNVSLPTVCDIASGRSWSYLPRNKIRIWPSRKLSDKSIEDIKKLVIEGITQETIAHKYAINRSTVSRIAHGLRRSHIKYWN
jgi:group I intron endonuclease